MHSNFGSRIDDEREKLRREFQALHVKLNDAARRFFLSKPHSRDMLTSLPPLELKMKLEFNGRPEHEAEEAGRLVETIETHVDDAILQGCAFRPGRVYCFFCESADCDHARPTDARHIFRGYSQFGRPEWQSMLDFAIARGDERVDRLAGEHSQPIMVCVGRDELVGDRLSSFAEKEYIYDIRGQIVLGYYTLPMNGMRAKFAVSMQLIRSSTRTHLVRLGINTIGLLPDGVDLEQALALDPRWPFNELLVAADRELAQINQDLKQIPQERRMSIAAQMADDLLHDIQSGIGRRQRREYWRTDHAVERAEERTRPTGMVQPDLANAKPDRVLLDKKKDTFVLLGPKGRVHILSPSGLHITSLFLESKEIDARRAQERWVPADRQKVEELLDRARRALAAAFEAGKDGSKAAEARSSRGDDRRPKHSADRTAKGRDEKGPHRDRKSGEAADGRPERKRRGESGHPPRPRPHDQNLADGKPPGMAESALGAGETPVGPIVDGALPIDGPKPAAGEKTDGPRRRRRRRGRGQPRPEIVEGGARPPHHGRDRAAPVNENSAADSGAQAAPTGERPVDGVAPLASIDGTPITKRRKRRRRRGPRPEGPPNRPDGARENSGGGAPTTESPRPENPLSDRASGGAAGDSPRSPDAGETPPSANAV